jgi:predicted AAA+ superfamily ATPase
MITKIKFLVEEGSFRYVLSGSLLGVELTNLDSAPVGYMTTIEMFPLDFEEFLQITNIDDNIISSLRSSFENRTPVMDAVNQKMLDLFTRYLIVGGMPEAVSNFADNSNLNDVMRIHRDILSQYKLDFTQYETEDKRLLLTNAYELIPAELLKQNRRYIVTDLKKGLHFDRVQSTFLWLKNAGVALSVFNSTEPRIPLKLNEKSSLFKLYLADVGMLTSEYGMNTKSMLLTKNQNLNAGGIYENAIAQELYSKGFRLYYYNSNRLGELDFVIEYNNRALPIEVKSGKDYTIHSAMNNCLANSEYQMQEGIVFANCNVSRKGKVTYLPIYMVMFLQKDSEQIVLDKIEF